MDGGYSQQAGLKEAKLMLISTFARTTLNLDWPYIFFHSNLGSSRSIIGCKSASDL